MNNECCINNPANNKFATGICCCALPYLNDYNTGSDYNITYTNNTNDFDYKKYMETVSSLYEITPFSI